MCKIEKCVKIEKSGRGRPLIYVVYHLFAAFGGRARIVVYNVYQDVRGGGGFRNSDTPGQGEGGGLKIRDFGGRPL